MVNGLGGRRPFSDAQRLDWPSSDKGYNGQPLSLLTIRGGFLPAISDGGAINFEHSSGGGLPGEFSGPEAALFAQRFP